MAFDRMIGSGVTWKGMVHPEWGYGAVLDSAVVEADVGKAMAVDTSADYKMKLAGDGDPVFGQLFTVEDRRNEGLKIGTVRFKGVFKFPIKDGEVVSRGDAVQGAGDGEVKTLPVSSDTDNPIAHGKHDVTNVVMAVETVGTKKYAVVWIR